MRLDIVTNTFLSNEPNNIRKQEIGLPMGTNSAPEIARENFFAMTMVQLKS